jgi:uncharacterized protein YbaR (Trm112 family)
MFIELVDALRCPVPHEESWLVASANRMDARHIVDGTLGCPVCAAEYPIRDGVVDFRRGPANSTVPDVASEPAPPTTEAALRLAALLDLAEAQGFAVLLGTWGAWAHELLTLTELPLVLVDPPAGMTGAPGISVVRSAGDLPLAAGAARAMAVDAGNVARMASAVRTTRARGRILAPAFAEVPADVRELARDESEWVGEKEASTSPLIALHVRRG